MNGLTWYDKTLFVINSLFAAALLFSYLLPFIPPQTFALLSVLSLGVPLLIILNVIFLIYWLVRFKKQILLSLIVLLLGFNHVTSLYEISGSEEVHPNLKTVKILSYNVRQFNRFEWTKQKNIPIKIADFIEKKDPGIVSFQEYYKKEKRIAQSFPYRYIELKEENAEFGLAIFSKYPIVSKGSLNFETKSNNNAIYADVVIAKDTLRIINVHFQSFSVKPNLDNLEQEHSKKVFLGMGKTFVIQQEQMEKVKNLIQKTPYKKIVMGDFNNTAYSYIYRELRATGLNDAYKEAGFGFGRSYDFDYFPLRIDYILPDQSIGIIDFETFEVPFSDHFPIMTEIDL